jgi:hypothetical protein
MHDVRCRERRHATVVVHRSINDGPIAEVRLVRFKEDVKDSALLG